MKTTTIRWVAAARFSVATVSCALVACGGGETVRDADDLVDQIVESTGLEAADASQPCALLDDAFIEKHFGIAAAEITREPSDYSPHPLCTVSWRKANADQIEAESGEAMMEYMKKKMAGEDVQMPNFKVEDEVSLTINKTRYANSQETVAALEAAMKVLSDGITREANGVEVTFQADVEPVTGVGNGAMWAAKLHQLSVAGSHYVFHVGVELDGDEANELARATEIASDLAAAL